MAFRHSHLAATFLIFLSLGTACVDEESDRFLTIEREIQGGQTETAETAAVGILINLNGGAAICTGTLVAPNLVVTAQHCVAPLSSQFVVCGDAPFGTQYSTDNIYVTTSTQMENNANEYARVQEILTPPNTSDACGFDIAVLILSDNIMESEATPIIPRIDSPPATNESYTAYGYGEIGDGSGSGTRRSLGSRRVGCVGSECSGASMVQGSEWQGSDGTCQGDSGGAALDSNRRLLGALSRGPTGCAGSIYSGVYAWADWLRTHGQRAADMGGYEPHVWVTMGLTEVPANDPDLDGVDSAVDNCPQVSNPTQDDEDNDGIGDACDQDEDGDGIVDSSDNCPLTPNAVQSDFDEDGIGDVCDDDDDDDQVIDTQDNCRTLSNPEQIDSNNDGVGDKCEGIVDASPTVVIFDDPAADGVITGQGSIGCSSTNGSPIDLLWVFAAPLLALGRRRRA